MAPDLAPRTLWAAHRLAVTVVVLLGIDIVLAWVALQATLAFPHVVWHGLAGEFLPGDSVRRYAAEFALLLLAQGGAWLATAVVFLAWLGSAQRRLSTLGGHSMARSPGQAVAAFLVPGVNLVRPVTIIRDLWRASEPHPDAAGTPPLVAGWWAVFLASVLLDVLAMDPSGHARSWGLAGTLPVMVGAEALRIAAAALAIVVVRRIDGYQSEQSERGVKALAAPGS